MAGMKILSFAIAALCRWRKMERPICQQLFPNICIHCIPSWFSTLWLHSF